MKKFFSLLSLTLCLSLFLITGCKNFFQGGDFINNLEKTIEYLQAPYADITITTSTSTTDFISPAAGNWNNTFKLGDTLQLDFTPTANYQFTKWSVTPEGSISFGENNINQYSTKVTAQIENIDEPITIEPKVYERPTITVSPGNTVENPRNSSIIISFSQNMNITEEDLSSIQILVDDVDALEYYQTPELNDEKNKITFVAKRENLIPVDLIAKTVKVLVPQTFNYLQDDCEITLKDLFSYSFRINSTTETKVNINFECELTQGEISFTGTKELYLDNEFSVRANPKEGYLLTGWSVLYKDDKTPVEENILQLPDLTAPDAQDLSELKIKVLTGSSKAITISPVFEPRGFVMVKFITDVGTTSPSEEKKYYVGDTINISYRESGNFIFTGWQSSNEEAVSIANKKSLETTCEIKAASDPVTVKALCAERPYVTGIYPTTLTTVNKDSHIKILFSQSITESSIYWTLSELTAERISTLEYDLLAADGKKDEKGNQYYYAYQKHNDPNTLVYKNIAIKERNGGNLLKHYTVPFFETEENRTLVIQSKGGGDSAPPYITIDVEVSPKFQSKEGVFVNQSYLQTFTTNSTTDNTPPNMKITYLEISGLSEPNRVAGSASFVYDQNFHIKEDESTYSTDNFKSHFKTEQDVTAVENMIRFISTFPKINSNSTIKIKIKGEISDEGSKPAFLSVSMVPTEDPRFTTSTSPTVKIPVSPNALGFYDFTEKEQIFEFPTNDLDGGIYKIIIKGYDNANNPTEFEKQYFAYYCPSNILNLQFYSKIINKLSMTKIKYSLGGNGESISLLKADGNMQIYGGTLSSNSYYLPISEDGGSTRVIFEINDESVDTSKIELAIAPSTWSMEQIAQKKTWKYPFTFYSTSFATVSEPIKECSLYIRDKNGFMLQKIPVYFIYSLNPNAIYANEFKVYTIPGQGTSLDFKFSPLENRKIKKVKLYAFNYEKDSTDYPTWEDSNKITRVEATDKTGIWTQIEDFTYEDDHKTISFTTSLDMSSEVTIGLLVRGLSKTNIYARAKFIAEDGIEYDWQEFIN